MAGDAAPVDVQAEFAAPALMRRVRHHAVAVAEQREVLEWGRLTLEAAFRQGTDANDLVHGRSALVDQVLVHAWNHYLGQHGDSLALVAVGGYGRGELHPHSDVDLLILCDTGPLDGVYPHIQAFLTFLWDLGLEVGHSVRSIADCMEMAGDDITVMTNLLESRCLAGNEVLFAALRRRLATQEVWATKAFFQAKLDEQQARHTKYRDTAYNLEPNVKEGPGGLRDIHTIVWVTKRHFGAETLHELVDHGFLTESEHTELLAGRTFLWKVRFALHMITGRREDQLVFDHQIPLARLFGYSDEEASLAVEQFMQVYYRTMQSLSCLNDMLLQLFQEAILYPDDPTPPRLINRRFQARHGFIEARRSSVFRRYPFALLEIFHLMEQHQELVGIRAETLRLIRRDRLLIDEGFRRDIRARSLFMEILREPRGITHALRRMNRYGVLGAYLPAFGAIKGRMQYDLFHTLTVDEHILFVLRNVRRLNLSDFDHELPFFSRIMQQLPKPELLYIAALFHDIAKGRGGDHSELGASDARQFCADHGLSSWDTELVTWLVANHLLMSMTAQKRDITDPNVIYEFALKLGDKLHLDYLFLLTVCDIRATNPNLWNSWRETLLTDLYNATVRTFNRGLHNPVEERELIAEVRADAQRRLQLQGLDEEAIERLWSRLDDDYFLRYSGEEVAWQTQAIASAGENALPIVKVGYLEGRGTTVFLLTRDVDYLFGLVATILARLGLSIIEARISSTHDGLALDSYMVTDDAGHPIDDPHREAQIENAVRRALLEPERMQWEVNRRMPRRLRYFSTPTQIYFRDDPQNGRTVMELVTGDRPGLLSTVGRVFRRYGVLVQGAKIATIGERAEDVFFMTDARNQPMRNPAVLRQITRSLTWMLNRREGERRSVRGDGATRVQSR